MSVVGNVCSTYARYKRTHGVDPSALALHIAPEELDSVKARGAGYSHEVSSEEASSEGILKILDRCRRGPWPGVREAQGFCWQLCRS